MTPRNKQYSDYSEIAALIKATLDPLVSKVSSVEAKVDRLEGKVDVLSQDRATRGDLDKLRQELFSTFVPQNFYEARHQALISRAAEIENDVKTLRADVNIQIQHIHDRLESGKQQIENRLKDQQEAELSSRDRNWVRWTQALGFIAVAITILGLIFDVAQHLSFR
jgi:hypothetical protein